jgi:hypothetical protein
MKPFFHLFFGIILFLNCGSQNPSMNDIDLSDIYSKLKTIEEQRIYFGHRSVGNNIIDGLSQIAQNYPDIELKIIRIDTVDQFPDSFFAHSLIGINTQPETKCDDFTRVVSTQMGSNVDIAFLKFCFADIKEDTQVDRVFQYYRETMIALKSEFPQITFIHLTVPLNSGSTGIKEWIKRTFDLGDYSDASNIKKNQFNDLMHEYYQDEPIFDVARAESTYPDGGRESFQKDGHTYYELIDAYTDSGGHLNEVGKIWVARELINSLATIGSERE